jgi:hypothetical protein
MSLTSFYTRRETGTLYMLFLPHTPFSDTTFDTHTEFEVYRARPASSGHP